MYGGYCWGFVFLYKRMFESRWGWASSAAPLPRSAPGRPTFSFYSKAGPVTEGSFSGNLRCFKQLWSDAKNVLCLLKFPSASCLFLFLNVLSIYDKYFFKPLLDQGLNPRARDEEEIWVKPCKYYAYSIRAQKSASRHSSANSSLTKAGEVFWKLSIRYINYIQSIHKINLRCKASLSLIEQIQTTNTAEVIFSILQTSLE